MAKSEGPGHFSDESWTCKVTVKSGINTLRDIFIVQRLGAAQKGEELRGSRKYKTEYKSHAAYWGDRMGSRCGEWGNGKRQIDQIWVTRQAM